MADSKDYEEKSPSHETVTVAMPSTESQSAQHRSFTESAQFKVVTPKYKTGDKVSSEINLGGATVSTGHTLRESNGEYRSEHAQEQFKMHVIDPKVNSNAYIPAHTTSTVVKTRTVTEDFPSHHNKRSLLKLDPMEQRKFRSVETRPITTNAYLNESLSRHRAAEESKLKQYLKAREGDANQPWDKPNWPGAGQNQESLRELEQIRKSIETLQKEFQREAGPVESYDSYCLNERYYQERRLTEYEGYRNSYRPMVPPPPPPPPPPPAARSPNKTTYTPAMTNNRTYTPSTNLPKSSMSHSTRPQTTSFNGPFFKMEEISPQDISYNLKYQQNEIDRSSRYVGNGGETVVVWPPSREEDNPRPTSSRSVRDPDRAAEYERQKQVESIAIQRKKQKDQESLMKQFKAAQLQQQRLESRGYTDPGRLSAEYQQGTPSPGLQSEPGPSPLLRVYETRPISAQSDSAYGQPSWRRTYLVEEQEIAARNEIIKSEEVLERERFDIDLLNRRDTFVEKPEPPVQIRRTGRVWQPPPDEPYVWPTASSNNAEFKWVPVVGDPGYKHEKKNFTPTPSPPHSPIKGRGTVPLDDVAQRQTRHVVTPQPDGSHRPKSVFKSPRSTPSGGFVPHAPNAVRVARDSPQPTNERRVVQESRYRVVNDAGREGGVVNDWEKIYELPPHASTLTDKAPPRRIDVSKRTQMFERRVRRSHSAHQSRHHAAPLTVITDPDGRRSSHHPIARERHSTRSESYREEMPSRPSSARSQRATEIFNEATRPSPPPASYNRARKYLVPALPPGRKEKPRTSPPRPPPGNTRRLLEVVKTASSSHQHNRPLSASLQVSAEPRSHDDLEELSRKSRELAERSKSRKSEFKLVGSEIVKTEHEAVPAPPQTLKTSPKEQYSPGSIGTTTSAALHQLDRGSEYITDQSSATWQFNTHYNTPFSPRSVISVNGNRRSDDGLLKIRTSQSVMNISRAEVETKPWPHMPADLEPVPDSPQSTMARQYHEERYSKVNHYNSMPALDTSASARGTTIQIQDEKQHQRTVMQPAEESESRSQLVRQTREVISSGKPRVTETIQRVEERKVTEETERRVLRRERKHRSHRSGYRSHHSGGHQEAIGWQEGGGTAHRSSSASRGGSYYAAGNNGYDRYGGYNAPPPPREYPTAYHRGYEPTYYHTSYNGYDMPPAYPRRTASATLYH